MKSYRIKLIDQFGEFWYCGDHCWSEDLPYAMAFNIELTAHRKARAIRSDIAEVQKRPDPGADPDWFPRVRVITFVHHRSEHEHEQQEIYPAPLAGSGDRMPGDRIGNEEHGSQGLHGAARQGLRADGNKRRSLGSKK